MSWPNIWGLATRKQPVTFHAVDECKQKRLQLSHGELCGPSAPMLWAKVKSKEQVEVDSLVPCAALVLLEHALVSFYLLNKGWFLFALRTMSTSRHLCYSYTFEHRESSFVSAYFVLADPIYNVRLFRNDWNSSPDWNPSHNRNSSYTQHFSHNWFPTDDMKTMAKFCVQKRKPAMHSHIFCSLLLSGMW